MPAVARLVPCLLCCQGHYLPIQNLFREQPMNKSSYNIIAKAVHLTSSCTLSPRQCISHHPAHYRQGSASLRRDVPLLFSSERCSIIVHICISSERCSIVVNILHLFGEMFHCCEISLPPPLLFISFPTEALFTRSQLVLSMSLPWQAESLLNTLVSDCLTEALIWPSYALVCPRMPSYALIWPLVWPLNVP